LIPNVIAKITAVKQSPTAAADPTWPLSNARE
jgi:hypothetical protein